MSYLIEDCPSAIYIFSYSVNAESYDSGKKLILPLIERCENFADSMHIHFHAEEMGLFDDMFHVKLVFNIKEPLESMVPKVSLLFGFAAMIKLTLMNQFFYPEK